MNLNCSRLIPLSSKNIFLLLHSGGIFLINLMGKKTHQSVRVPECRMCVIQLSKAVQVLCLLVITALGNFERTRPLFSHVNALMLLKFKTLPRIIINAHRKLSTDILIPKNSNRIIKYL